MIIFFDEDFKEIGFADVDLDAEVGTDENVANDFEMTNATIKDIEPYGFYVEDSEIGGVIEYVKAETDSDVQVFRGYTWRGLLSQAIISPPSGSDYYTVSGEANEILATVLADVMGGFFNVPSTTTDLTIDSYSFPRYCNVAEGLENMLEDYGYRLKIYAEKPDSGEPVAVYVEAVEASTISGYYNEDSDVPLIFETNKMGINHLICGGSGELSEREIIDLYIDADGAVSTTQYYTGFDERTAFYDYASAESTEDLTTYGTEELLSLASSNTMSMETPDEDFDLEIGDLVSGVFPDGTVLTLPIVSKVYKISGGILSTEIKIKGEE